MTNYPPLNIKRNLKASRQAVWDAWTQPEKFKQWYMPAPFSVPKCEFDLRPGGALKIETKGPDGSVVVVTGEFKVIDEPSKLVMTNVAHDAQGNELFEVRHSLELSEDNGQTVMDLTAEVLSAGPESAPFLQGMQPGLNMALDQMSALVEG